MNDSEAYGLTPGETNLRHRVSDRQGLLIAVEPLQRKPGRSVWLVVDDGQSQVDWAPEDCEVIR